MWLALSARFLIFGVRGHDVARFSFYEKVWYIHHNAPGRICASTQVTLAVDARPRDVLESAMFALAQCVPSFDAVELWQADDDGRIRCKIRMMTGGEFCRPNQLVDGFLHAEDIDELRLGMNLNPTSVGGSKSSSKADAGRKNGLGIREDVSTSNHSGQEQPCEITVLKPQRTPEILAAPFRDLCFKIGKSWIGADRLARGFALVLRTPAAAGRNEAHTTTNAGHVGRSARPARTATMSAVWENTVTSRNNENETFVAAVAKEVGVALACVRGRERRAATRALALKRLSTVCTQKTATSQEANEAVLKEISAVLPGCRAYVGVLQPGGNSLLYEAATRNSSMLGRELHRGEGVSFASLDTPEVGVRIVQHRPSVPLARPDPPQPPSMAAIVAGPRPLVIAVETEVEVWYASSWLPATVVRGRGHEFYDVKYKGFGETEAGVPRWRIRDIVIMDHLHVKVFSKPECDRVGGDDRPRENDRDSWPWPFVCVPLRSRGNQVGVLGLDGWANVPLGRDEETHPEKPVVSFLKETGALLAAAHYAERRQGALSALGAIFRGEDTTVDGALEAVIVLLREAITFRRRVDVLEIRAGEPGTVYCRGTWGEYGGGGGGGDHSIGGGGGFGDGIRRERQNPVSIFETGVAPREAELSVTPLQVKGLDKRGARSAKFESISKELSDYQQEVHLILRDGPSASSGLQATALASRPGEIIGRFQRLAVRSGIGRPCADGWYLLRVGRTLPEVPLVHKRQGANTHKKLSRGVKDTKSRKSADDGDLTLVSDMCRRLEMGFMAIAGQEQRACVRLKALDRVLACCGRAFVGIPNNSHTGYLKDAAIAAIRGTKHASGVPHTSHEIVAVSGPGSSNRTEEVDLTAVAVDRTSRNKSTEGVLTNPRGASFNKIKDGNSNPILLTTVPGGKPATSASNFAGASSANIPSSARVTSTADANKDIESLHFSAPIPPPTAAEMPDGRKGALVSLKDGRLAVLVQQGERRVAVVELPRGKQEIVAESEVRMPVHSESLKYSHAAPGIW